MKIETIGQRGILFTFAELLEKHGCLTSVYVIVSTERFFCCDTYIGCSYMEQIRQYLRLQHGEKQFVVFNSHYHWDHVWGNAAFSDSLLISSAKTHQILAQRGAADLHRLSSDFPPAAASLLLPQATFSDRLSFPADGVEFFVSPGHTTDSASCYDHREQTLFVGDNLELPAPSYDDPGDLPSYLETLAAYKRRAPRTLVLSHGGVQPPSLLDENSAVLQAAYVAATNRP